MTEFEKLISKGKQLKVEYDETFNLITAGVLDGKKGMRRLRFLDRKMDGVRHSQTEYARAAVEVK